MFRTIPTLMYRTTLAFSESYCASRAAQLNSEERASHRPRSAADTTAGLSEKRSGTARG